MAIHDEVLRAAVHICRERGDWVFKAEEVVLRLPHLKQSSVRTHIVSRCCTNAPRNHPHKWDYFERVGRGVYTIRPPYRKRRPAAIEDARSQREGVAETAHKYALPLRDTIHAVVCQEKGIYIAECVEIAVVTQGRSIDEVTSNLQDAIHLHLEGENPETLGLMRKLRLSITCEIQMRPHVPKT